MEGLPQWLRLDDEPPDKIDAKIQAKAETDNWACKNAYESFVKCSCVNQSNHKVDLIDIYGQKQSDVAFCPCTPDVIRLLQQGYVAGSPNGLNHNLKGCLPKIKTMLGMCKNLSQLVFTVMKMKNQQILACTSCPACFGPEPENSDEYPEATRNCLIVCLDGNFQHCHHTKASHNYIKLESPRIFIPPSKLDQMFNKINAHEVEEEMVKFMESHKAANDKTHHP
ncbi:hypothetical protein PGT21_035930 [Puccinia graminis f. sp. tritici]|uniref:CxC1-like cysteine cluster associated with KDZ transposases domain-containing protein n=1 Tax=Puccinia graminis f. sp. tritici TaxID=56615 RepID=A0A5B0P0Y6_PUCGR|nr:hypothetical protein PGT21_035930 [Puccinia graminis f. sp. tritici]